MKSLMMITVATIAVASTSCNTFIGLGRDMRLAGEGMEKTANKATGGESSSDNTSGAPIY